MQHFKIGAVKWKIVLLFTAILLVGEVFLPMINTTDTLINVLGGLLTFLTIFLTIKLFNKL